MKLILRADDVGYTDAANIGTFRAIEEGLITSADVMLDCPGTIDALERLKRFPWISLGWHGSHFWGRPVSDPMSVPSLVDENGFFKWAVKNGGSINREQSEEIQKTLNFEELVTEMRAQVDRCIKIFGRAPDTTSGGRGITVVDQARDIICKEYGIATNWFTKGPGGHDPDGVPCRPEYAHLGIYMPYQGNGTNKNMTKAPAKGVPELYDPIKGFYEDGDEIMDKEVVQVAFHPGYLDEYIMYDGGLDTIMTRIRVMDVHFMCSKELRDFIKTSGIELINQRDALYGTQEYQNHLKLINSDLCVI